jgi:hypothetical protein
LPGALFYNLLADIARASRVAGVRRFVNLLTFEGIMELAQLKKSATAVRAAFESSAKLQRDGAEKTRTALAAVFPDQATLKAAGHDAYTLIRDAAEEGWTKGGGTEGSFRVTWTRALKACSLQAIGKDGNPTAKGKGGGAKKADTSAPSVGAKSKISDEEACQHFFGHADKELINCLLVASKHEVSFIAWVKSLVVAPKEGELKAA